MEKYFSKFEEIKLLLAFEKILIYTGTVPLQLEKTGFGRPGQRMFFPSKTFKMQTSLIHTNIVSVPQKRDKTNNMTSADVKLQLFRAYSFLKMSSAISEFRCAA